MTSVAERARKRISEKQRKVMEESTLIDLLVFVHTSGSMPSWLTFVPGGGVRPIISYKGWLHIQLYNRVGIS